MRWGEISGRRPVRLSCRAGGRQDCGGGAGQWQSPAGEHGLCPANPVPAGLWLVRRGRGIYQPGDREAPAGWETDMTRPALLPAGMGKTSVPL